MAWWDLISAKLKNCSAVSKKVYANETNTEARVGGLVGSLVGVAVLKIAMPVAC